MKHHRSTPPQTVRKRERPTEPVRLDRRPDKATSVSGSPTASERVGPSPDLARKRVRPRAPASGAVDYEIGYRKPPKQSQWRKGQSGNSKGRPSKARTMQTIVSREANRAISIKENGRSSTMPAREVVVRNIVNNALKGDASAQKQMLILMNTFMPDETDATTPDALSPSDAALLEQLFAPSAPGGLDESDQKANANGSEPDHPETDDTKDNDGGPI